MTGKRRLWPIFFAVAALTFGGFWVARTGWPLKDGNRSRGNQLAVKSLQSLLKPGVARHYQVELASKAVMLKSGEDGTANANQPDIEVKLTGRIALEWESSSQASVIRMRFEQAPLLNLRQVHESSDFPPESATISSLMIGVPFSLSARGQLSYAYASAVGDRFAFQLLRQIAAALQVCMPDNESLNSWDCDEQDGAGTYQARYDATGQDGNRSLRRVKTGYSSLQATNDGTSPPPLRGKLNGDGVVTLPPDSWIPQLVTGQEDALVTILVDGGEIQSKARTSYSIRFDGEETTPSQVMTSGSVSDTGDGGATSMQTQSLNDTDNQLKRAARDRFGDLAASELLKEFEAVRNGDSPRRVQSERDVYDKLVGYVRIHDKDLSDILKTLSGRKADDPWLREVLSAFAYVGCNECQVQLVNEIMARESEPAFATDLLSLLAQPEQPIVAVEGALRRLSESPQPLIHDMAELALGTVGYRLRESDTSRSTAIYRQYADKFRQSHEMPTQMAALSVLGNIGDENLVDELKPWIASGDDVRREAAAKALRNLKSEGARSILLSMLADDAVSVRRAAVQSITQMPKSDSALKAVADKFSSEKTPLVRQAMVQDLARYLQDAPRAQEVLREAANHDVDPDVRLMATNAMIMYGVK